MKNVYTFERDGQIAVVVADTLAEGIGKAETQMKEEQEEEGDKAPLTEANLTATDKDVPDGDDFDAKFTLVKNAHVQEHQRAFHGCMFETFGEEMEQVIKAMDDTPARVWTIVDYEGVWFIAPGYHHVNRLGHLITKEDAGEEEPDYVYD